MQWHAEREKPKEDPEMSYVMTRPSNAGQWEALDIAFPRFGGDARNIGLGMSTDGLNLFGNQSSMLSTWPVFVWSYNLPTWLCTEQRSKDGTKARYDLKYLRIRKDLEAPNSDDDDDDDQTEWTQRHRKRAKKNVVVLPAACFTTSPEDLEQFFRCLLGVKVPHRSPGNISRYLDVAKKRFTGMKSHDCHVLMTQILPVAVRGIMDVHVRDTLFGPYNFFDVITRKSIGVRQLKMLQDEIVVILCELEICFPPAFYVICVQGTSKRKILKEAKPSREEKNEEKKSWSKPAPEPTAPDPAPEPFRYVEHQDHGEDVTPWSREGEEQLIEKMYTELDPTSPEERKEEETDGRSRTERESAIPSSPVQTPVNRPHDGRSGPDAVNRPHNRPSRSRIRSNRASDRVTQRRLRPRHPAISTTTTTTTTTTIAAPPQGMKTILVLIDHMLAKKTLALTQGEVNSIAMLVLMNDLHKNKLLTKIVIKRLAMPTMGMTTIPKTTSTTTWRHMVMLPPKVVKSNQGVISGIILAMTKGAEGNHNMIKMREP
ncbi:hypothetical protein QYE76_002435 [Lolium multiflorum]|uniref:Uncharacterized protein n=1 Tax=Lolium multiflorum TaxID=4521 RepID=A0AAD8RNJ3_LOLMU|nr:hypothetical protein QYE76_002435 [Lolium multiflorum]